MLKLLSTIGFLATLATGCAQADNAIIHNANIIGARATAEINEYIQKEFSDVPHAQIKPIYLPDIKFKGNCAIDKNTHLLVCATLVPGREEDYKKVSDNLLQAYINEAMFEVKSGTKQLPDGVTAETYTTFLLEFFKKNTNEQINSILEKNLEFFDGGEFAWVTESDINHLSKYFSATTQKDISEEAISMTLNCAISGENTGAMLFDDGNKKGILLNKKFFGDFHAAETCTNDAISSRMQDFVYQLGDMVTDLISDNGWQ